LLQHCCWCGRGFTDDDIRQTTDYDDRRQPAKRYWPIRRASNNNQTETV